MDKEAVERTPNPGSDAAIKLHCRCPVMDNAHGAGIGGNGKRNGWWINGDCPVHSASPLSQGGQADG